MTRIPGKKDEKLKFLESIGEKEFPYLIGDILFHVKGHSNIKILDGPGDGRRDILSNDSNNKKCITQCKFHYDSTKTVGSRETDEIVLALNKFDCSKGFFCTNGKVSPQGKREYIDNFPNFDLDFLEGTDIVNYILSNPSLNYVWFEEGNISDVRHSLGIPFVIKLNIEKESLNENEFESLRWRNIQLNIQSDYIKTSCLEPFRKFHTHENQFSNNLIKGYMIIATGPIYLHEISEIKTYFLNQLIKKDKFNQARIRFGIASYGNYKDNTFSNENLVNSDEPITYIIENNSVFTEREWLLPKDTSKWIFPPRFGTLEASWTAWYNPANDICLTVELKSEYSIQPNFIIELLFKKDLERLENSLFLNVNKEELK